MVTNKIIKTTILALFASALILTAASCAGKGPEDGFIMARLEELVEQSYEINDIFFGEGLAYYDRDSDFVKENIIYDDTTLAGDYDYAVPDEKYMTIGDIKTAAEQVYTADYLDPIYTITFIGHLEPNVGMIYARYMDDDTGLMVNREYEPKIAARREYIFGSAEIKLKNGKYVVVELDSRPGTGGAESMRVSLTLKNQDGVWLLDSPTY